MLSDEHAHTYGPEAAHLCPTSKPISAWPMSAEREAGDNKSYESREHIDAGHLRQE